MNDMMHFYDNISGFFVCSPSEGVQKTRKNARLRKVGRVWWTGKCGESQFSWQCCICSPSEGTGSDIMVDHVLLGNGRMLALIYPIDGKEHYRREADGKYEYSYAGYSTLWDAKKDKLMSYKYIRRKCDVLTFRIVQAVMGWL